MDISLDDVIHFDAITSNPATGAAVDADSTPTWAIYEEATDTAIVSGNFTKRTSLDGNYRGTATLSTADGFETGKWYNVIASATVGAVVGKAVVMRFAVVVPPGQAGGLSLQDTSAGTGARTITITVNDGATVLQNAKVRLTEGVNTFVATTNASGVATLYGNDASYAVGIAKDGHSFAGATLVVDGNKTVTYSMTAIVVTPPTDPSLSAIEVLCVDSAGAPESGVEVDIRIASIPSGSQNIAFKGAKQTATSDDDGIARFEVVQGSVCEWKRGLADVWQRVTIDSDGVTNVTSVIGSP